MWTICPGGLEVGDQIGLGPNASQPINSLKVALLEYLLGVAKMNLNIGLTRKTRMKIEYYVVCCDGT